MTGGEISRHHVVVGVNHRSSAAATRDRLFIEEPDLGTYLGRLRGAGLTQAILLSTCARVEVQTVHEDPVAARSAVIGQFAAWSGLDETELSAQVYAKSDEDAVRHIFTVTASLDSPVIGEPQVTGQVKDSHQISRSLGMTGAELESVLQAAYGVAKRVRSETTVGERPVSIAAAAVQLARDVHGDLARRNGLLVVGGDMGELIAGHMLSGGLGRLTVVAPVAARGEYTARRLGCHYAAFGPLDTLLLEGDIVISSLGTGQHVMTTAMVEAALTARRRRPVFFIDAAIPGDIEPGVNDLDGAFLYDLDDLERIAESGRAGRDAAATAARDIVDTEVAAYLRNRASRQAVPTVAALRSHFEAVRANVLADTAGANAEEVTRRLINRLLHDPSRALGEMAARGDGAAAQAERLLRRLFELDGGTEFDREDDT